ncbi:ATP-binding protein [Varunaivibrio sulfuroxidans]|uniref:histidine kinase n=1 Tax=Varunaivibrio sulfuroxidans TaxID=1773489 RepID=A0A4R3JGA5_9PROT|nr:ATP-binding protein [Varunaivibrio sulfuroxidans]TCS64954.1 two-component system phosphate regulon sensor histidine kinase PhoR [Varunaivibrio sulfuroxidans]WES29754.1 ATP-binding protein [Varunaivibrio sulfuroxidans]
MTMGLRGFVVTPFMGEPRTPRDRHTRNGVCETASNDTRATHLASDRGVRSEETEPQTFRRLFDALSNPILLIDEKRRVLIANAPAREMFGNGVEGRDLTACLRHPGALQAARQAIEGVTSEVTVDIDWPVPVARSFSLRLSTLGGNDTPKTFCLEFREQTRIKAAQASRRDFIANISHELRTPLSALMGFIDTLRGPANADVPAQKRFLDIMGREARRMNAVIDELITLSHVEAEEHVPPIAAVDIPSVLRQAVGIVDNRAKAAGVKLELRLDTAAQVSGEREQILQMAIHLITNAIQYGGGEIVRVSLQPSPKIENPGIRIEVRDFGPGIAPEHLPRLTERFYRADMGRSRVVGGAGLGLAIVKHIVNRHRGRLTVSSAPGQGSVFTVTLPIRDAPLSESSTGAAGSAEEKK